jgi:hypothetical protein
MTALVAVPDTTQLTAEATQLVTDAQSLVITDARSYAAAAEFGKGIKALQKKIVDFFAPMKKKAHESWKQICESEKNELSPTEEAERITKEKMLDFQRAEQKRLAEETRAREIHAKKLEEDRRLQEAIDLEEEGDRAGADDVLAQPVAVPIIALQRPAAPKVAGVATTKRWTFNKDAKIDVAAVIKHIAGIPQDQKLAHPELVNLLTPDTKCVQQRITADRENFNVPGIHAYESDGLSLGSK